MYTLVVIKYTMDATCMTVVIIVLPIMSALADMANAGTRRNNKCVYNFASCQVSLWLSHDNILISKCVYI